MSASTVLYLLDYVDLGGGETSFLAFIEQWLREVPGVRPVVVVPGEGPVGRALEALGAEVRVIPYPRRLRRGPIPWFSLAAAQKIEALARQIEPAIIHANNFFGLLYAGWAARRLGVPLVWTCHGAFDIDRPVKRWIARRFAAHVSCVSEAVRREAERHLPAPGFTSTDYLGIQPFMAEAPGDAASSTDAQLRLAVRAELGLDAQTPLLGVIGRFQPVKGHDCLLDALPAVRRRLPELKVWVIGDALFNQEEQEHKRKIERRVREEGLGECVRFLGFRSDARRLIRALDALVIPSEAESFSMVTVEGLEAGVPVIGPDGGGPKEIITPPQTGLLFEPKNPASLAEKIIAALMHEGEGRGFDPQAGPRRVAEQFSASAHLHRTLALYERLCGAGRFA